MSKADRSKKGSSVPAKPSKKGAQSYLQCLLEQKVIVRCENRHSMRSVNVPDPLREEGMRRVSVRKVWTNDALDDPAYRFIERVQVGRV